MAETVTAADGTPLPLSSLAMTFTYSGANVQTISVSYRNTQAVNKTYTQTFTYSGANVTNISQWIPS